MQIKAADILKRHYEKNLAAVKLDEKEMVKRKYRHSYEVLKVGRDLYIKLGLPKKEHDLCDAALLLHDLGRFYQIKDGQWDFTKDHGDLGGLALKEEGLADIPELFGPVVMHNKPDGIDRLHKDEQFQKLSKAHQERIFLFLKIVMDADMVANLIAQSKKGPPKDHFAGLVDPSSTQKVLNDFNENKQILNKDIKTRSDCWIFIFAWRANLSFEESKRRIKENGAYKRLLMQMKDDMVRHNATEKDLMILSHIEEEMIKSNLI